ncbi:MAG TPA: hypothetical protein GX401_08875 [Clostridiales bacterium]|nr:hypothetical protein [Clostridiales bacterium]
MDFFVSAVTIILTIVNGLYLVFNTSIKKGKICKFIIDNKNNNYYFFTICFFNLGVLIVFTILDICNMGVFSSVKYLSLYCLIFSVLFVAGGKLFGMGVLKKYKGGICYFSKVAVVALLLELTVFNFNSYVLVGGSYTQQALDISTAQIYNMSEKSNGYVTNNNEYAYIQFNNINKPVGTVRVDASAETKGGTFNVGVNFSDATNKSMRTGLMTVCEIMDNERSQYAPCHFSGDVSKLSFNFNVDENNIVKIHSITINSPIPLNISVLRFSIIFGIAALVYLFYIYKKLRKPFFTSIKTCKIGALIITAVFIVLAFTSINMGRISNGDTLYNDFSLTNGNQITQELVDAFENGSVEVSPDKDTSALEGLDNPYDWSEREEKNVPALWDHVYYNGSYYSYYGIAPVLLVFLPYHLLTGYYCPTSWAVLLFSIIGIVFLTKLVLVFFKKFFSNVPASFVLMSIILLQVSSGVWFNLIRPDFYEIAQSSGFTFVTAGAYFLLASNVIGDGKISLHRIALSSGCLALAVLCRPTLAVYCFAALLYLAVGFLKTIRNGKAKKVQADGAASSKFESAKYLLYALLPFVIIGGIQMVYNYMRFGSFTDFGIDYSLTINDFTQSQYHTIMAAIGLFNFILAVPIINTVFPFVHSNFTNLDVNGYYFIANTVAVGIMFRALPMFSYLFARRAYTLAPHKTRKTNTILILASCVLAPLIIIFSIWESGYGVRYSTDFSWEMIIGALAIGFTIYLSVKNESIRRILERVFLASVILAIIINVAMNVEYQLPAYANNSVANSIICTISRTLEFWK